MGNAADSALERSGKGLALPGLIIGLLTGLAVYGIVEYWIDGRDDNPLAVTVLFFVVTMSAAYLLMAEAGAFIKALGGAIIVAVLLAWPDYFMAGIAANETNNLSEFPTLAWFLVSRGLAGYLLVTLIKASLESGAPPSYRHVFFHGVTLPLIAAGAKLFALLAVVLLFTWARLLKELDVSFFNEFFQKPWFLLPFMGAIGGLSIALMRGQQSVLGALRFVLLLLCRMLMVITAVFTITLLIVIALKGVVLVFDRPYPSVWMMVLALYGMLIFNGVYQNGEGGPPPLWLRLATLITLVGFPVYVWLAFYAFWIRIEDYGLTPPRIAGLAVNGLIAAYAVVCVAGLMTELNWRGKKWMPLVGPLNTMMAGIWIIVAIALATPLVNPWEMSAKSQYERVAEERTNIEDFDFGYMRFKLGKYGDRMLEKMLTLNDHPEIEAIRAGVKRARSAKSYWEYQNPGILPARIERPESESQN
ncbi:DUF4153 domain-containing protein [Hyphococcus flavus]|uniref:DUF4153 domain-containing protein n=1 Tax=Hyphococcus flavus TaxID=1866326 RepID=A0AAF0CGD4_9PROT|nr:DUF4153 domain-containing protein [Hyphococcus flavus]WDI32068.1 DUF4153 domain-containing protein [Hyphococcus flavus]